MRIGIAGIIHEALNFSPNQVTLKDFRVLRGQSIVEYYEIGELMQRLETVPVPVLVAPSLAPGGVVDQSTYLELRDEIVAGLRDAGPLDGICLILHGAMLVEHMWSGETDLVRSIRAAVGNEIPIAVRLDMHANLTEEYANKADLWCSFRTAPHRDQTETLHRTLTLLARAIRSGNRPRPVFIRVPLLLQGEKATTGVEPMRSLVRMAVEIEQQPGILSAEVFVGFGWADAPHSGSNVVVTAESEEALPLARAEARRLAQAMWDHRNSFTFDQTVAPSADAAIEMGLRAPERSVFISDSGDNPTAGATGDVPYFLSRLIAHQVPDAVVAGISDPEAAQACFEAGVGARVTLRLGGKMDREHGDPLEVTGTVEHIFRPESGSLEAPLATLQVGGVRVIISARRKYFKDLDDFRRAGIDPLQHKLVVVKLGYLMPALRDAAPKEILALTPGFADMELSRLPYRYVCRPVFPLDREFAWQPVITNNAGYGG